MASFFPFHLDHVQLAVPTMQVRGVDTTSFSGEQSSECASHLEKDKENYESFLPVTSRALKWEREETCSELL